MPKKLHPADIADRAKVETATHFNVHLRTGPTEKINQEAATLRGAIKIADEISAGSKKPAMIYAITPEQFTVLVPKGMIEAERAEMAKDAAEDEAMKKPLTSTEIAQLSAILTGDTAFKRANSKAAAEARFRKLAAEKGIEDARATDFLAGPFDYASLILRELISGKPQKIKPQPEPAAARDGAAPAKGDDYPAPKRERDPRAEKAAKAEAPAGGKRAAILEAAQRGELPSAPDFSAETHKRFRSKLARLVEMADAGDIAGLKAEVINPVSSSPKAMDKYRNLAVIALEARKSA